MKWMCFSSLVVLSMLATAACVGDGVEPVSAAPDAAPPIEQGTDAGETPSPTADAGGDPSDAGGDPSDAATDPPEVKGHVLDHVGLPLSQASVVVTGANGHEVTLSTGSDGAFSAAGVEAPYRAIVQRSGSMTRHVYYDVATRAPRFRTYGEYAVTETERPIVLDLDPSPEADDEVRVVASSKDASFQRISYRDSKTSFLALAQTTTFPLTLSVLVGPSNGRPTARGQTTVTASTTADNVFETTISTTAIPPTGGIKPPATLVHAPGLKVAMRALKLELDDKRALAIGRKISTSDAATTFSDFETLGIAGATYAVEALAAHEVFAIAGRGTMAGPPFSYSRKGGRAENALNIAVELAQPPLLTQPVADAVGFPRTGPFAFTASTGSHVHALRISPKESTDPGYIVYTGSPSASISLPGAGLEPSAEYTVELMAFGPFATLDAFLEAAEPIPLEVLQMAHIFREEGTLVGPTTGAGDSSFAVTGRRTFTTGN